MNKKHSLIESIFESPKQSPKVTKKRFSLLNSILEESPKVESNPNKRRSLLDSILEESQQTNAYYNTSVSNDDDQIIKKPSLLDSLFEQESQAVNSLNTIKSDLNSSSPDISEHEEKYSKLNDQKQVTFRKVFLINC